MSRNTLMQVPRVSSGSHTLLPNGRHHQLAAIFNTPVSPAHPLAPAPILIQQFDLLARPLELPCPHLQPSGPNIICDKIVSTKTWLYRGRADYLFPLKTQTKPLCS